MQGVSLPSVLVSTTNLVWEHLEQQLSDGFLTHDGIGGLKVGG